MSAETTRFLEGQKIELTGYLPYSPALASNDFYLFPSIKNKLRGQRFSSRKEAVDFVRPSLAAPACVDEVRVRVSKRKVRVSKMKEEVEPEGTRY
ncbi:hypothetical protein EVAR_39137_1 [Eumeta japonica]|uniref:Histone-lysine N-methyltransferase SETMAR n=1 Tax=Eumeta variegata TaxID=151549 RepID=A0A4C1X7A4_EUMVA|nr:hypothetical protein EVAR_39137_1 [Eumeta japonica]